ncbi:hypothetical protein [Methylocystis rosea]|uniref:Uncharacterized protein n=1 Tax=Methylocystis rosea TaxID=173366 RepID=A0A3G8M3Q0_9HYPH|nr:hypothetical protein [Methylocystis rosea]AZG76337.1 hypothetical protein EHO51_06115 [Methylocystis rosea]
MPSEDSGDRGEFTYFAPQLQFTILKAIGELLRVNLDRVVHEPLPNDVVVLLTELEYRGNRKRRLG